MGQFRRKVFSTPSLNPKQFPDVLSVANLSTAGWFQINAVTGWVDPITTFRASQQDGVIPISGGFPVGNRNIGEYAPQPFLPAWAPGLISRRNFTSMLINYRFIGTDPVLVGNTPLSGVDACPVEDWNDNNKYVSIQMRFDGGLASWGLTHTLGVVGPTQIIALANFVDVCANVVKINFTRVNDNLKNITFTCYDSVTAGWITSAPVAFAGAGFGNIIPICTYSAGSPEQGINGLVSYLSILDMRASNTNIDHTAYTLPQM